MSDFAGLTFADAPPVPTSANFLLYGSPGSGKSTAAATAPGPILWINAEGAGALAYARKVAGERGTEIREVRVERDTDVQMVFREAIKYVRAGGGDPPVRTIAVDTLGKCRETLIRRIVQHGTKNVLQQFGEVSRILGEFVGLARDLDVNVVLLAHEDVQDAEGERIVRPMIGGNQTEAVPAEMDVVAFCSSWEDEDGARHFTGQLVEAKGRRAKDRSGALGKTRPLDITEWLDTFSRTFEVQPSDETEAVLFGGNPALDAEPSLPMENAA